MLAIDVVNALSSIRFPSARCVARYTRLGAVKKAIWDIYSEKRHFQEMAYELEFDWVWSRFELRGRLKSGKSAGKGSPASAPRPRSGGWWYTSRLPAGGQSGRTQ